MVKMHVQGGVGHAIFLVAVLAAFPVRAQRLPQEEEESAAAPARHTPPATSAKPAEASKQVIPTPTAAAPKPAAPAPAAAAPASAPASAPVTVTPPPPAAPAPAAGDGVSYTVRLHELERQVNELKEQIFRSKARLNLLKETVLHGAIAGSRAVLLHRNEMGATYSLTRLVYALDGAEIYGKTDDSGHLGDTAEFEIYNGLIVPGNHTVSVVMIYQGNGFGVFSYLKGYRFTVRASYTFAAVEGKTSQLKVVGYEKGNAITTDPKDRPAIDFRLSVLADRPEGSAQVKK